MMRIISLFLFSIFFLIFLPNSAQADIGLPMLAIVWPGSWILILPIIILEALIAKRILNSNWGLAFKISGAANAVSTIVGIPITWFALALIFWLLGIFAFYLPLPESMQVAIMIPFYTLWLPPIVEKHIWLIPLSATILCLPFFFASFILEKMVAGKLASELPKGTIRIWALKSNLYS